MSRADTAVILDFETSGLSPDSGDRAIEIGAVKIVEGKVTERFQSLINPDMYISSFIEDYTGITNAELKNAPTSEHVMSQFANFIEGFNLIAHNASFDKRFLDAELARISRSYAGEFTCSLLAARRIYQDAPNHRLGTLVDYIGLPSDGTFHRALYDSEMTAKVWLAMLSDIQEQFALEAIPFSLMKKLNKTAKKSVRDFLVKAGAA